jgi:DNA-directed RNA polymerase subunit M/transcription elongation factor TFIIS
MEGYISENSVSKEPSQQCQTCSSLHDQEYTMQKYDWKENNTYLPAAAGYLKIIKDFNPYGSRKLQLQQCPECGNCYLYRVGYVYLANGSEDEEYLTRLTDDEAVEYLHRPIPQ